MIFNYIRLKNFRQYKGEHKYEFAKDDSERKMTIIVAKNGVGKTTFLQAFRYCFYGDSPNYLKLPRSSELINNTLKNELEDKEITSLFVEVSFMHKGVNYIAKREHKYQKVNNNLAPISKEEFKMLYSTESSGFKTYTEAESYLKIMQILPPGLSHIFMFDGERMEKRIESNEYKRELRDSMIGILDLKKIDSLIDYIGTESGSYSILKALNNKISYSNEEQRKQLRIYNSIVNRIQELEAQKKELEEEKTSLQTEINEKKHLQKRLHQYNNDVKEKDSSEQSIKLINETLTELGEKYISIAGKAIKNKLLLSTKKTYDNFINKESSDRRFFQYLHADTLSNILEKEECLCGTEIHEGSEKHKKLIELFNVALPIDSAHHLNIISDNYKKVVEFKEQMETLEGIKEKIREAKARRLKFSKRNEYLTDKIRKAESDIGEDIQLNLDLLITRNDELTKKIGEVDGLLKDKNRLKRKQYEKVKAIEDQDEYNRKIADTKDKLKEIKKQLRDIRDKKDQEARRVLSKLFNRSLSSVIVGEYEILVDKHYNLTIVDKYSNEDVTDVMSTGQSVIVSLSFIQSLIQTAKRISSSIDNEEKYGVIMDAALSNVDETHIFNLCKNNINTLEQVLFLSFKRQLRHEMFDGIKDNIGKAYVLEKEGNTVKSYELNIDDLEDFIHEVEEEQDELL